MSSYDSFEFKAKSDKELFALCSKANEFGDIAVSRLTTHQVKVMLVANMNAQRFGFQNWRDCYNALGKRFW